MSDQPSDTEPISVTVTLHGPGGTECHYDLPCVVGDDTFVEYRYDDGIPATDADLELTGATFTFTFECRRHPDTGILYTIRPGTPT